MRKDEKVRRLYMAYFDDGILDLFVGWIVFFTGLMLFTDMFWMAGAFVAIFLPIVWSVKEKVTMPRLRREELNPSAAKQTGYLRLGVMIGLLLVAILGLIVFVIFRSSALTQAMREMALLFASVVVAATILGGFLAIGRIHRAPRWYAYAVMTVLFAALAWGLQIGLPWVIMAIGAMISLGGTIYLARFLLNHPVLSKKERPVW